MKISAPADISHCNFPRSKVRFDIIPLNSKTMKTSIAFVATLAMIFWATSLSGQPRMGIELRIGPTFATTELGDAELKTGTGMEALIEYQFSNYLGAFAGWGWNQFSADRSFAGPDRHFEETGYLLGLKLSTTGNGKLGVYVRAGALINHIEVESDDGDIIADSGHGLGFRGEVGLDVGLGSNWYLRPGVKYQELSRDLSIETVTTPVDLKYLGVQLGIAKKF